MQMTSMEMEKKSVKDKAEIPVFVTGILDMMNELTQIMVQENDLVIQRRNKEHKALLQRKQRLTMDYHASMKTLASQPETLKQLPEDFRQILRTSSRKLADAAERNARLLRSAVVATQRLLQNIIAMVKLEALPKQSYKNPQTSHLQLGSYSPTCKPVAVNRTV